MEEKSIFISESIEKSLKISPNFAKRVGYAGEEAILTYLRMTS